MNFYLISLLIVLIFISLIISDNRVESRKDSIKLKDISVLTLNSGKWTTGRRTKPVPQLQCIGTHCSQVKPQSVQCYNRGSDGVDIQWECKTEMNSKYRFGQIDVICEGYDYPEDEYVLIGSCGLEYSIQLVDDNYNTNNNYQNNDRSYSPLYKDKSNSMSFGFIICAGFAIFLIYYTCLRPRAVTTDRENRSSAGPPPPPGFRSDFYDSGCGSSSYDSTFRTDSSYRSGANTGRNNGNGFWSGLFAGGTLGYLFGSRTNSTNYSDQSSYFGRRSQPPPYFSSGSQSGGFGSSSTSSSTTTTTGFGGTKRR